VVGYCNCEAHIGYMGAALMQKHECKKKHCQFFEKVKIQDDNIKYSKLKHWQINDIDEGYVAPCLHTKPNKINRSKKPKSKKKSILENN